MKWNKKNQRRIITDTATLSERGQSFLFMSSKAVVEYILFSSKNSFCKSKIHSEMVYARAMTNFLYLHEWMWPVANVAFRYTQLTKMKSRINSLLDSKIHHVLMKFPFIDWKNFCSKTKMRPLPLSARAFTNLMVDSAGDGKVKQSKAEKKWRCEWIWREKRFVLFISQKSLVKGKRNPFSAHFKRYCWIKFNSIYIILQCGF